MVIHYDSQVLLELSAVFIEDLVLVLLLNASLDFFPNKRVKLYLICLFKSCLDIIFLVTT